MVVVTDAGYGVDQLHCDQFQQHVCVTKRATSAPCLCLYWLIGGNIRTYIPHRTAQKLYQSMLLHVVS
jgi:hypothetical protein